MPFNDRMPRRKLGLARWMARNPTTTEAALWKRLRGNQLGVPFVNQEPILGYTADFYCHAAKLVVEIDGSVHESDAQHSRDGSKDEALVRHGLVVLRVSAALTVDEMVEKIDQMLDILEVERIPSVKQRGTEAA